MRDFFSNKRAMMILSIVFAVFLWTYVVTDQNPRVFDTIDNVPVELTGVEGLEERGLIISDSQEYLVDIRVYGRRNDLININKENIKAQIDVSQLDTKGSHYLPINISGIPEDVEISRRNPEAIEITLDQIVTQEKNVEVEVTGKPSQGSAYMNYIVDPKTVQVEGPENALNNIRHVAATIDISNANEDVNRTLPLRAIDNSGQQVENIKIIPHIVDITIPVRPTKTVPVVENIVGELPQGYEITNINVSPSRIFIGGSQSQLNAIERISTEEINISGKTESFEQRVQLQLPEGTKVINGEGTVTVKVSIKSYPQETFEVNHIELLNLREPLSIQEDMTNQPIKVILSGPEDQIDALQEEDISPYIDVKNLGEGQHDVSIQLNLPEGILLKSMEPDHLSIHIQREEE